MTSLKPKLGTRQLFIVFGLGIPLVVYCLFVVGPTLSIFLESLFRWNGLSPNKKFVGLKNYTDLFGNPMFLSAISHTVFLLLVSTAVTMGIAIFFAVTLVQSRLPERGIFRVMFFFPNVLSVVVIGIIFRYVYAPNTGILNSALEAFGIEGPIWLGDARTVLWAISGAMVWQAMGYYMLIYMAGLDDIPPSLYEAADLDGASKFRQFIHITIPMLWDIIRVTLVFYIISSLNLSFTFVRIMTDAGPNKASEVLLTFMYDQAFENGNFGYAMAAAFVIFVLSFGLALLSDKLTERKDF
ncbi:MAG: sugar ABC transporter permease [Spirochaetales bacterium]|nr:sugar ABC transporter permease [Spirochaetales bacterium]